MMKIKFNHHYLLTSLTLFNFITFLVVYALLSSFSKGREINVLILIAVVLVLFRFCLKYSKPARKHLIYKNLLLLFFSLKLLIAGIYYYCCWAEGAQGFIYNSPNSADTLMYNYFGKEIAQVWKSDGFSIVDIDLSQYGYTYICAVLYYFLGYNPFLPVILNIFLLMLSALIVFSLTYSIFKNIRIAKISSILICLSPAGYLWASLPWKESIVTFLFLVNIYCAFKIFTGQKVILNLFLWLLSLIAVFNIRLGMFWVFLLSFVVIAFFQTKQRFKIIRYVLILFFLVFIVFNYYQYLSLHSGYVSGILRERNFLTPLGYGNEEGYIARGYRFSEGSIARTITSGLNIHNIYLLPIKMGFNLIIPFPFWTFRGFDTLLNLNTPFTLSLLPLFCFGLIQRMRHDLGQSSFVFVPFLVGLAATCYALIGVDARITYPIMPFFYIFASVALINFSKYKRLYYVSVFSIFTFLPVLYFIIKFLLTL